MKLIFATIMTMLLAVGLGFCVYQQEWIAVFVNAAFMLQFAQQTIRECQAQSHQQKQLNLAKRKLASAKRKIASLEKELARYRD